MFLNHLSLFALQFIKIRMICTTWYPGTSIYDEFINTKYHYVVSVKLKRVFFRSLNIIIKAISKIKLYFSI